jgi:hypothetical protein
MKDLKTIAEEINLAAAGYAMRDFQEIRRQIHGLSRIKDYAIFTAQTIHDEWAFHSGGRKELQFNIGFEGEDNDWFRYGVAFSLEPSHTLPKPLVLKPKILKLNQYLTSNAAEFEDLRFWYDCDRQRSTTLPIGPIPENVIRLHTFLFWGKMAPRVKVRSEEVLFLFDRLLSLYRYVEGGEEIGKPKTDLRHGFQFTAGCATKPEAAVAHSVASTKAIALRHNALQTALHKALSAKHGEANVGTENDTGRGSRVDLVVRDGAEYAYYEIKTSPCIKTCLREAVSQLMEYSYWPGGNVAKRLVVVSENPLTQDARRYIGTLRRDFKLPLYYQRLDMKAGELEEMQ